MFSAITIEFNPATMEIVTDFGDGCVAVQHNSTGFVGIYNDIADEGVTTGTELGQISNKLSKPAKNGTAEQVAAKLWGA
jgi:hypothetical protein